MATNQHGDPRGRHAAPIGDDESIGDDDMHEQEKTAVILRLPSTLSKYSEGRSQLLLTADTIEQLFHVLEQSHPLIWQQLCGEEGQVRKRFSIFVNNQLVTSPNDPAISLKAGQEVIVLPVNAPQ